MARRDASVADFATDSMTSPAKTAFLGTTAPSTSVATVSLARTLVPTGVLPAVTFCSMITGNSRVPEGTGAAGVCCASKAIEQRTRSATGRIAIVVVNIGVPLDEPA